MKTLTAVLQVATKLLGLKNSSPTPYLFLSTKKTGGVSFMGINSQINSIGLFFGVTCYQVQINN